MDLNAMTQIIGSIGFPIAACCALFWYLNEETKAHKDETAQLQQAVTALELAITKLTDKLDAK